jgi:signal transduction histidine kinase
MITNSARKLLLVEDEASDSRLIREMLNEPVLINADLISVPNISVVADQPVALQSMGVEAREYDAAPQVPSVLLTSFGVLKYPGATYECTEVSSIEEALEACEACNFDCAIVDYKLPGRDGLAGIPLLMERLPYMAIIMTTGRGDEMTGSEAIKRGALDYIPKKYILPETIKRISEHAIETMALRRQLAQQRDELETFAHVLVHDLKAPTRSIQLFAAEIETSIRGEKIIEDCRRIGNAAKRMDTLIDTLYQYTTSTRKVVFEPVETGEVMKNALSNLEHDIRERGANVTHSRLPAVIGNAAQLTQLFQNLIGNGIKYCKAEVPTIHVTASQQDGATWLFSVDDNGIGIPADQCQQIFEPFKRLHSTEKYEGTGLGLATCKKVVERHGGTIWCESEQGLGTAFFFTLRGVQGYPQSIL